MMKKYDKILYLSYVTVLNGLKSRLGHLGHLGHLGLIGLIGLTGLLPAVGTAAPKNRVAHNPDFTQGESIPQGASHDWTLGATGARGWMYSEKLGTEKARQIKITQIEPGSAAEGKLAVGDVILGIGDKVFATDARIALGQALTEAESTAGGGQLNLLRWREGKSETVTLELPVLGDYSPTAPYDCAKSALILKQGCEVLAERIMDPSYNPNPIPRALNALALLASGDPTWMPVIQKEAEWAKNYSVFEFSSWYYGHVITFLAEYALATGDTSVLPGLRRLAIESAKGQSIVGSWGHRFAGPDGRLVGYGMMNSTGIPLTIALELARRAGVDAPEVATAIERSAKLVRFYIGKGAVPYGDHHPWTQMHEDNGKCGMAAVLFNLLNEEEGARFFSRMSLASYGSERDTGHTGNFWNILWAMPGVNQSGPQATGAWMQEFGSWYFDLARRHDGQYRHQGPPQAMGDSTSGWDATGAYLLAYAMPLKQIYLTGKQSPSTPQLTGAETRAIVEDGRGWTNADRHSYYDQLSEKELLKRLGSWSPVVRERAAVALSRRKEAPLDQLIRMLEARTIEQRLGACQTLAQLKGKSAPAVPKLIATLQSEDMWLRIKAADALAAIGPAAIPAAPDLLKMLAREPGPKDPRGMEQRYLCFALFDQGKGLLSESLEGVDRDLLKAAVYAGLRNQDGRARFSLQTVYKNLPPEELRLLLPEVHNAVLHPAPSGIMFADGIRMSGMRLLSEWKVSEGIDACMFWLSSQNHWRSEKRTPELLETLRSYGVHARRTIPELEKLAEYFDAGNPSYFPEDLSKEKARHVRETIEYLQNTKEAPVLITLPKSISTT